ncbi:MAG: hypothetical protein EPO02_00560 [Nitrospirae bacterium]|nr:MAG: hypothetical protein EPO02_00560 [Nitrospirota bacterium]
MKRLFTGALALLIALAFSTSTFAQATPAVPATPAQGKEAAEKEKEKAERKAEKEKEKAERHAKKEGKKHGLDRADEAAGEHGRQGRENARAKQGR